MAETGSILLAIDTGEINTLEYTEIKRPLTEASSNVPQVLLPFRLLLSLHIVYDVYLQVCLLKPAIMLQQATL